MYCAIAKLRQIAFCVAQHAKCHIIQIENNIFNFPFIFKHFRNLRELSSTLEYKCKPGKQHPNL